MQYIMRDHSCHPTVSTPRVTKITNCVTQTLGNQPTIGRSLTFVRDDNPRRLLLHSIRHRHCQLQPLAHICRCAQPAAPYIFTRCTICSPKARPKTWSASVPPLPSQRACVLVPSMNSSDRNIFWRLGNSCVAPSKPIGCLR